MNFMDKKWPVRFNRVPEKVPGSLGAKPSQVQQGSGDRVPDGGFGAEPGQVQQGSGECSGEGLSGFGAKPGQVQQGSGEGLGGFGAEPGQVQQGSGEGSGEGLKALVRFQTRIREALVQSQVKFSVVSVRFGSVSVLVFTVASRRKPPAPSVMESGSLRSSSCFRLVFPVLGLYGAHLEDVWPY